MRDRGQCSRGTQAAQSRHKDKHPLLDGPRGPGGPAAWDLVGRLGGQRPAGRGSCWPLKRSTRPSTDKRTAGSGLAPLREGQVVGRLRGQQPRAADLIDLSRGQRLSATGTFLAVWEDNVMRDGALLAPWEANDLRRAGLVGPPRGQGPAAAPRTRGTCASRPRRRRRRLRHRGRWDRRRRRQARAPRGRAAPRCARGRSRTRARSAGGCR